MKDQQAKDGKNIGYNFYINLDGDDDDDIECSKEVTDYTVKRLNKALMKLIHNVLSLFYEKDIDTNTNNVHIPKYNVIRSFITNADELNSTFSYEFGTRNSSYELDRYIANKMMIIFNNVQEVLQKQYTNIFITDTNSELSNNINIFGYYAGHIRFDIPMYPGCDVMAPEVTVQSKYLDKRFIGEYFYERNEECKPELIIFSKRSRTYLGGKNNKKRITKKRRYSRRRKIRQTKFKKTHKYNMELKWPEEPDPSRNGIRIVKPLKHAIYYHQGGGREKLLKFYHDRKMKEMRDFIEENKGNNKALEEGYNTYFFNSNDYKALLQEAGLVIEQPPRKK